MTEKPYIEYNNERYEFEGTNSLKRQYQRELKQAYLEKYRNNIINEKDYKKFQDLQKKVENNPNLKEEDLENNQELRNELIDLAKFIDNVETPELNEKYCRLMLKNKYNLTENELNNIIDDLYDNYGIENADTIMKKVCEKVFTIGEEKSKKPLPNWIQ